MHNIVRNYWRIIIQMHFHRLKRVQKWLLNTFSEFIALGYCFEAVGGTTIQQCNCRHSTKRDIKLQKLMSRIYQSIWSRNLGQKCTKKIALVFIQLWFYILIFWKSLQCWRWGGYICCIWIIYYIEVHQSMNFMLKITTSTAITYLY